MFNAWLCERKEQQCVTPTVAGVTFSRRHLRGLRGIAYRTVSVTELPGIFPYSGSSGSVVVVVLLRGGSDACS